MPKPKSKVICDFCGREQTKHRERWHVKWLGRCVACMEEKMIPKNSRDKDMSRDFQFQKYRNDYEDVPKNKKE